MSLSALCEGIGDFVILSGGRGRPVEDIRSRFSDASPQVFRYVLKYLGGRGFRISVPNGTPVSELHSQAMLATSCNTVIIAPHSLCQKSLGVKTFEEMQGKDGESVLALLAASQDSGILATDFGKEPSQMRVLDRLNHLGLIQKRIVYPPSDSSSTLRTNILHLHQYAAQYDTSSIGVTLEHDDFSKESVIACISLLMLRHHIKCITMLGLANILQLSVQTIKQLRYFSTNGASNVTFYDDDKESCVIKINHELVLPVEWRVSVVSLPLFEQLLPMVGNKDSDGAATNALCTLTGLSRKEATKKMEYLTEAYGLSHCVEQAGKVHTLFKIKLACSDVLAVGGIVPIKLKLESELDVATREQQTDVDEVSVIVADNSIQSLHDQRSEAVWNCLTTSGGICSLSDCHNAVKKVYAGLCLNFSADRKTVVRILERFVEARKVLLHTVSEIESTSFLKTGTKLVVEYSKLQGGVSIHELCRTYAQRLAVLEIDKKSANSKGAFSSSEVTGKISSGTIDIPEITKIFPDIDHLSKNRIVISVQRDEVDKGLDRRDHAGVISYIMGISQDGLVWSSRCMHETFCKVYESIEYSSKLIASLNPTELYSKAYPLSMLVKAAPFRELVKSYWMPFELSTLLCRFATGSKRLTEDSLVEHGFVLCIKDKCSTLDCYLALLRQLDEGLQNIVLMYYCEHARIAFQTLSSLGLVVEAESSNAESTSCDAPAFPYFKLILSPRAGYEVVATPEDCILYWKYILIPFLKQCAASERSTPVAVSIGSSSVAQLKSDDSVTRLWCIENFNKAYYDRALRKQRVFDINTFLSRRFHNYDVTVRTPKRRLQCEFKYSQPRIKRRLCVDGIAQVSSISHVIANNSTWSIEEDAFLVELFLDQFLLRSVPNLPETIRYKMQESHMYCMNSRIFSNCETSMLNSAAILFAEISREFSRNTGVVSTCTYPAQSLFDLNYIYVPMDGERLFTSSKRILKTRKMVTSGGLRLDFLLKSLKEFRKVISFLICVKFDSQNSLYGYNVDTDLLNILNSILDPIHFEKLRGKCSTALEEAAMSRYLQFLASGEYIESKNESNRTSAMYEDRVVVRVLWELFNNRFLRRAVSSKSISETPLEGSIYEKTDKLFQCIRSPSCATYSRLLCNSVKHIQGVQLERNAENYSIPSGTRKKCRRKGAILSLMRVFNANSSTISAAEALGVVANVGHGMFSGAIHILRNIGATNGEVNVEITDSLILSSRFDIPNYLEITPIESKRVRSAAVPLMGRVLNSIEIDIELFDDVSQDCDVEIGTDDNERDNERDSHCILGDADNELLAIIRDKVASVSCYGISIAALFECLEDYNADQVMLELKLCSVLQHLVDSAVVFLFERSKNITYTLEKQNEGAVYGHNKNIIEILLEPKCTREKVFDNIYVIDSAFRKLYYASNTIESRCPWVRADGSQNTELYSDFAAAVISCLSASPGSPLEVIHAILPTLSAIHALLLLIKMAGDGLIECRKVRNCRSVPGGPFTEVGCFPSEPSEISLYFLADAQSVQL